MVFSPVEEEEGATSDPPHEAIQALHGWGFRQQGRHLWVSTWHETLADHASAAANELPQLNLRHGQPVLHAISLSNPGHLSWTWVSEDYKPACGA